MDALHSASNPGALPPARTRVDYQHSHTRRHLLPFEDHLLLKESETRVMVRGQGAWLWDCDGKRYLDGMSGLWCATLGYDHPELIAAATAQLHQLSYCSQFFNTANPAVVDLSERLAELFPDYFGRVLYTNSGSEANETLIRTVRRFWQIAGKPEKRYFVGRINGYHGSTTGTVGLGGMGIMHSMGGLHYDSVAHINEPHYFAGAQPGESEQAFGLRLAQELETKILVLGADNVAAFIAEPFQGAGGVIIPPGSYWPEIQRICLQYDVLLCIDEVVGGFGRMGEWLSGDYFGISPDTITIAKGLTSGYVPMGALILSPRMAEAIAESGMAFAHGLTYQGHPVGAAVALATLRVLDQGGIMQRTRDDIGPYFQRCLRERFDTHVLVGQVQGHGMVAALQFALDRETRQRFDNEGNVGMYVMRQALQAGLIVRPALARAVLAPPLICSHQEIDELVELLGMAVDTTARALKML